MTTAFLQNAYEESKTVPKCMCYIFSEVGCPSKLGQPHETTSNYIYATQTLLGLSLKHTSKTIRRGFKLIPCI